MCDGPAEYVGETDQTLELLPSLKKQTGSIVNVAMPFATNVVTNELLGLMNIGMRYVTTGGQTQTLRPVVPTDKTVPVTKLRPRVTKEIYVPQQAPPQDANTVVTLEAMAKVSEDLANQVKADEALNRILARQADDEYIPEETATATVPVVSLVPVFDAATLAAYPALVESQAGILEQEAELRRRGFVPGTFTVESNVSSNSSNSTNSSNTYGSAGTEPPGLEDSPVLAPAPAQAQVQARAPVIPIQPRVFSRFNPDQEFATVALRDLHNTMYQQQQQQRGGGPLWGGGPPLLSVDTSPMAMAPLQGGLMPQRRLRMASPYQQGGFVQQQQVQLDAGPQQQSYNAPILVRKLE